MKKFSFLKYSALCLVALFSAAVITSCDKDGPEEPDAPVIPENPDSLEYPNILYFDGAYLSGINGTSIEGKDYGYIITYKDFNKKFNRPNIIDIYYKGEKSYFDKKIILNYNKKIFENEPWGPNDKNYLNFTSLGYLSVLYNEKHNVHSGTTTTSAKDKWEKLEYSYQEGNKLSKVKIYFQYEEDSSRGNGKSWYKSQSETEFSLTWKGDNLIKINKEKKAYVEYSDSERNKEISETTVYDIDYDSNSLNESKQYPMFVSLFIMENDPVRNMFPMLGLLGNFSKNLPVKVTVTKDGKVEETNDVIFTKTMVNSFNVIATERYKGETFEYLYE